MLIFKKHVCSPAACFQCQFPVLMSVSQAMLCIDQSKLKTSIKVNYVFAFFLKTLKWNNYLKQKWLSIRFSLCFFFIIWRVGECLLLLYNLCFFMNHTIKDYIDLSYRRTVLSVGGLPLQDNHSPKQDRGDQGQAGDLPDWVVDPKGKPQERQTTAAQGLQRRQGGLQRQRHQVEYCLKCRK